MKRVVPRAAEQFQRISWDDALAEIKSRWTDIIAKFGTQAIMPHAYLGHQGTLNGLTCGDAFFNRPRLDRGREDLIASPALQPPGS